MRRQETQLLADILAEVLKENKIDNRLLEMQIVEAWFKILGTVIKKYTSTIYVRNHKLCVLLSSSVLKHDLMMTKGNLIKSLNKEVNNEVINDIIFL